MKAGAATTVANECVTFGEALLGPENEPLRSKLRSLWFPRKSPLWVSSLLALGGRIDRGGVPDSPAGAHLLLDLDHLFLLEHRPARSDPACGPLSLVRYAVDGSRRQPFRVLEEWSRQEPFRFPYPLSALDVLRSLWDRCGPGRVTVLSLSDGRIETGELVPHPGDPSARGQGSLSAGSRTRHRRGAGNGRSSGRSLRRRTAPEVDRGLLGVHGPVRELRPRWSALSLPVAATSVAWNRGAARDWCHGQGLLARHAESVAVLEALERFQVVSPPPDGRLTYGSFGQLEEEAVDPRTLFFERLHSGTNSRLTRYADDVPLYWTRAEHWSGAGSVLVPAQEVWFGTVKLPGEHLFVQPTTNACAVGSSRDEAALFALFEAIERDAYLTTWYLRRRCRRLEREALDHEPLQMLWERWELLFPRLELHLFDLTSDTAIPTVCAIAMRDEGDPGPRTIHSAAARPTLAEAAFAAVKDVSALVTENPAPMDPKRAERLLRDPDAVQQPRDHFDLYGLDETFERLRFFPFAGDAPVGGPEYPSIVPPEYDATRLLERTARHLEILGIPAYFKNIGFPWLEERGVHCVKAIAPGLFPMWFGRGNCRFAVTTRLERLAREWLGRPLRPSSDLNLEIHPFS